MSDWAKERFETESREVKLRQTTKAPLVYRIWAKEVWQWEKREDRARRRLLIIRREADGSHKYSISNACSDTSWERLGFMQAQRFWIERAFQDAKSELGMAQYEVRTWRGWHHHMALVCLAMLFTLKERILAEPEAPILSARDAVELLAFYLPRRSRAEAEVLRAIEARHAKRAKATERRRPEAAEDLLTK